MDRVQATTSYRKRKAEDQDSERLSKKLSLLNIERSGNKLYVPVDLPARVNSPPPKTLSPVQEQSDDLMQVDDSKFRVWVHNLDDELSDSESDDGKLVFLPDIQKHLRESRIPPSILANKDGELAGMNKQLVLYSLPSALTVPEEQDSVRKAVLEARARLRAKQKPKPNGATTNTRPMDAVRLNGFDNKGWQVTTTEAAISPHSTAHTPNGTPINNTDLDMTEEDDDPDAMDIG
ncbi:hypothetical protein BJ878DRAFT_429700 [Calycina marina]|uniref:Uncharacterized protein n=1 Tax=Calycina marina TaxID=1763456 RepID=A0A9P7YX43_9HELO|nr:hypothetical protein BJ878DRAFT_429700 [Calycina marina]